MGWQLTHADVCMANNLLTSANLLPRDGRVYYFPNFLSDQNGARLMNHLMKSIAWKSDQLWMFGKLVTTRRQVAWLGDPNCAYTYSGVKKEPQPWTKELLAIKNQLRQFTEFKFNSCLLNLYHDGNDGMGWHSDDECELDPKSPIASLSLGATRKFNFRHRGDKSTISVFLESGSLLLMNPPTQTFWQHALIKSKSIDLPRINLTFRNIRI